MLSQNSHKALQLLNQRKSSVPHLNKVGYYYPHTDRDKLT